MLRKPKTDEYHSFYLGYVNSVPDGSIVELLADQAKETDAFFRNIPVEKQLYRYEDAKWSIKEILGHINDVERILSYRAVSFARDEKQALPGFEEDDYVAAANFDNIEWSDLLEERQLIRRSSITLFKHFSNTMWERIGNANGSPMITLALPFIIYGHEKHHRTIIEERYL